MGLVVLSRSPSPPSLAVALSLRRSPSPQPHIPRPVRRLKPHRIIAFRLDRFTSRCSVANTDIGFNHIGTENEVLDDNSFIPPVCSIPVVHFNSDILESEPLNLLTEDAHINELFTKLPVLSEEEQDALAATPAHPSALYALYASSLAGNLVEQLWNFAWPAAVALLHPSLLPVAVVGFFTKLAIFLAGPLVGNLMDSFPRVPAYSTLNLVQAAAQLLSVAMIIRALSSAPPISATSVLLQPWFIVLVLAGAVERLSGLALGVAVERDWVVLLAGANRPIALAQANAILSRIDLLCEITGASLFGILLSKYSTISCLKAAASLMMCTLPVVVSLAWLTNKLSSGVLDRCKLHPASDMSFGASSLLDSGKLGGILKLIAWDLNVKGYIKEMIDSIQHGWMEYKQQPVLPASLAYVLLYFNVVLAPGGIMTAFLIQCGLNPSIIGGFSSLCAFMGVAATFISAGLVRKFGVLKAGAVGLMFQSSLLIVAVGVYWSGSISHQAPLLFFLSLIVLSRLGHMLYDVVGAQILQTGIPPTKANLIGTTEVSMASLAEFVMLGVTIIANDVSHFGFLAMLSVFSVLAATWMFCQWLANPTDEQRKLFAL